MEPRQLLEWIAYLDGIGETDDQLNTAGQTAAIVNELRELRALIGVKYKNYKPPKLVRFTDYLRRWRKGGEGKRKQAMTPADIFQALKTRG